MSDDPLQRYRSKRDFDVTPEPSGDSHAEAATATGGNSYVVQKHAARRLHYDLRFEVDGVMASWAVPKGPSYDPKVKRLAVHVEDHPLDYRTFEGMIPGREYGAGSVIVWDEGTYTNITERRGKPVGVREAIEGGHLSVFLDGQKLHGGWALTRTGENNWIMVKRRDDWADPSLDIEEAAPQSVQSGRLLEEVASDPSARSWTRATATWQPPQLATLVDSSVWLRDHGEGWTFERKLDGLRCVAVRNGETVELWSRNHNSFTARFSEIAGALRGLPIDNFTFDGELVAHDGHDFVGFGRLQQPGSKLAVVYCVFDLLHLLGQDTREIPLDDRQKLLRQALEDGDAVRVVPPLDGDPADLLAEACADGWEGLIAKRDASVYVSGRSPDWVKLKCSATQELVIGGWTEPRGARSGFGALLFGYYDGGNLRYAGKVGSGYTVQTLETLSAQLRELERPESPFVDPIRERNVHWTEPRLVANVAFSEWTRDGKLRHPRFEGLRPDKEPRAVVRERP
jgi:bifunctional non-homologous end joining protein LigD